MEFCKYKFFVPFVYVLFMGLAVSYVPFYEKDGFDQRMPDFVVYGVIGLILNGMTLEKWNFHGIWSLNEKCGIVVLMVTRGLFLLIPGMGLAGLWCQSIITCYVPGFLLMGVGVALVAFGGATRRESWKDLSHDIMSAIRRVNGTRAEGYLNCISGVQWEVRCHS